MKTLKLAFSTMLLLLILAGCKKNDEIISKANIAWGSDWNAQGSYLKATDLNEGKDIDSIFLGDFSGGVENLVFNKNTNSLLYSSNGSLYSVDVSTHLIKYLMPVGTSITGLRLDNNLQIMYGLEVINSKCNITKIDLDKKKSEIILSDFRPIDSNSYQSTAFDVSAKIFYFCLNDSLYSFDINKKVIEKSFNLKIYDLQYSSLNKRIYGISFIDGKFQLAKFNVNNDAIFYSPFTEEIFAIKTFSALNENTGEYIFKGNGNLIHIVDQNGKVKSTYTFDFESCLEFEGQ
jgi:hypothetical protein